MQNIRENGGKISKIVKFMPILAFKSGSNYMQLYANVLKVDYRKANRGHKQSWLYKNRPIFVQNAPRYA